MKGGLKGSFTNMSLANELPMIKQYKSKVKHKKTLSYDSTRPNYNLFSDTQLPNREQIMTTFSEINKSIDKVQNKAYKAINKGRLFVASAIKQKLYESVKEIKNLEAATQHETLTKKLESTVQDLEGETKEREIITKELEEEVKLKETRLQELRNGNKEMGNELVFFYSKIKEEAETQATVKKRISELVQLLNDKKAELKKQDDSSKTIEEKPKGNSQEFENMVKRYDKRIKLVNKQILRLQNKSKELFEHMDAAEIVVEFKKAVTKVKRKGKYLKDIDKFKILDEFLKEEKVRKFLYELMFS